MDVVDEYWMNVYKYVQNKKEKKVKREKRR